jgi:hypothetical protein
MLGRPHWLARGLAFTVLVALAAIAPEAAAQPTRQRTREWYLPTGVTLGAALHPGLDDAVPAFVLGGEVSFTSHEWAGGTMAPDLGFWIGGYVDGLYDFGNARGRLSTGVELGWTFFGLDGGPLIQLSSDDVYAGGELRALVTVGFAAAYVRQGFVPADPLVSRFTEVGALLKLPIPIGSSEVR